LFGHVISSSSAPPASFLAMRFHRVVAPERDYSPDDIKAIDCRVILERMISAPGKSPPAQVPGLQHSRNIVSPATFRPT
jgi:hypothetical protein